ncbi:MAG: hypothetical protein JWO93_2581 [Micrococcaceae bacterium]|jgi:hypothetical protein|nr:hypothetical protein [Micrococcaceae bacterium]
MNMVSQTAALMVALTLIAVFVLEAFFSTWSLWGVALRRPGAGQGEPRGADGPHPPGAAL